MLVPTIREGVDFWILQIVLDCFVVLRLIYYRFKFVYEGTMIYERGRMNI